VGATWPEKLVAGCGEASGFEVALQDIIASAHVDSMALAYVRKAVRARDS
jgi:hypothetical protein